LDEPSGQSAADFNDPSDQSAADLDEPSGQSAAGFNDPSDQSAADLGEPSGQSAADLDEPSGQSAADFNDPSDQSAADLDEPSGQSADGLDEPSSESPPAFDQGLNEGPGIFDFTSSEPPVKEQPSSEPAFEYDELDEETPAIFEKPAAEVSAAPDGPAESAEFEEGLVKDDQLSYPAGSFAVHDWEETKRRLNDLDYDPVNDPANKAAASIAKPDASLLEPEVIKAPEYSGQISLSDLKPEPLPESESVLTPEPIPDISVALAPKDKQAPQLVYTPPRPAELPRMMAEASTAVIVNYLEDSEDNFVTVHGQGGELAEEDDLDIDLMDMHAHEPIRLEARPMAPAPKIPL
ncbi:MAG: hypothetical protein LBT47_01660, partial [Deltaproteobacteria bacterium]|nr:hypothetical protein [Deltaproteobacteria bacterium]